LPGSYLARPAAGGPGTGGDNPGAGRVRISLVPSVDVCVEAARRMREFIVSR
jgi:N-succinyldiaminopimelate aminotransferase